MGWYTDLIRKEAKEEAIEEYTVELAERMIEYGESVEKIAQLLKLSVEKVTELMKNMQNTDAVAQTKDTPANS